MTAAAAIRPHLSSFDTGSFVRPVHRMVWHPVPLPLTTSGNAVAGRQLLVLGDVAELVAGVADALREAGAQVDEATPAAEPDAAAWDGIIDLNVTGYAYHAGSTDWQSALDRTTRMVQRRYADWRAEVRAEHCCYLAVTAMGGLMGYQDSGCGQPLGGIWAGMAKCLPRELPTLAVKVVDVDPVTPDSVARAVLAELATWDLFEIGYRQGKRHALTARRSRVGPARFELGMDDVVLISGGARGVGFALARGLAEQFGCRVVVTGRTALPTTEDWFTADDETYQRDQRRRIASARGTAQLRAIRGQIRREVELRQVRANLAAAANSGLRIFYEPCDCTDSTQVRELFGRIPAPSVVVHNAGIDDPKRLDLKTPDEVVRTVDIKVTGFANLVREILAEPGRRAALKVFCNVGSLAGRMGGMIGQIDYASGNEALARLGFWERDAHGLPVQTLCWPTWERLGVITNYDAAVRYVSTIAPADGVRHWIEEIHSAGTDEVMFIGQIGSALVPAQLRGFRLFTGHPDLPRLHTLAHFLGAVEEFEPFRRLRSTVVHRAGSHPCLSDFTIGGVPALPVSVLLEQACAVADWVVPPGWPLQHLTELRDISVHLPLLRLHPDAGTPLRTQAVGAQNPEGWTVAVTVTTADGSIVAALKLRYQPEPPEPVDSVAVPADLRRRPSPETGALSWSGLALGRPRWHGSDPAGTGETLVLLPVTTAADLWTSPFPPTRGIDPAAIEAVVRAARPRTELRIRRIIVSPGAQNVDILHRAHGEHAWSGSRDGRVTLRIEGSTGT